MRRGHFLFFAIAPAMLAAACAGRAADGGAGGAGLGAPPPKPAPSAVNLVPDGYQGRFEVRAAVLENQSHGPQLCTAMMDSYPPQCGGPDVKGWKWSGVRHDSAAQTKWGSYLLVGYFDGKTFTLTEPARSPEIQASVPGADTGPDFTTPCPQPPGGWKPTDLDRATDAAFTAAVEKANGDPDFGGLWIDEPAAALDPTPHNDPQRMVLNVTYTKDLDRHEAELREIWGGALCVSTARHTEAELARIQDELTSAPGVVSAGSDPTTGTVNLGVFVALESRQRELDARYGAGVVVLQGLLKPVD
jgi:hypothetical protein